MFSDHTDEGNLTPSKAAKALGISPDRLSDWMENDNPDHPWTYSGGTPAPEQITNGYLTKAGHVTAKGMKELRKHFQAASESTAPTMHDDDDVPY